MELIRDIKAPDFTLGKLSFGDSSYWTCEDGIRDVKVLGKTAIDAGTYQIIVNHSQRFNRDMPLLLNVPNFEGVRIHSGNGAEDTDGCILLGLTRTYRGVGNSRAAFDDFFPKLKKMLSDGDVWLTIT